MIFVFEFRFGNHKSKIVFMMDITYYWSLILINVLILCKYYYFEADEIQEVVENIIIIIVYFMIAVLISKLVW